MRNRRIKKEHEHCQIYTPRNIGCVRPHCSCYHKCASFITDFNVNNDTEYNEVEMYEKKMEETKYVQTIRLNSCKNYEISQKPYIYLYMRD